MSSNGTLNNQLLNQLDDELATAARLGVKPTQIGEAGFDSIINNGTVKYFVTQDGKLLIGPHSVNGQEIFNAVLSQEKPVLATEQAEIAGSKTLGYFGLDISNHSGHYMNSASTELNATVMSRTRDAFSAMGINF